MRLSETIKVSCVLVCYNQEKYILDALKSLELQTYQNVEIIISDDSSCDRTFEIIKYFLKACDPNFCEKCVYVQSNPINLGLTRNFENAFEYCTGEIICVFAGDDISDKCRVNEVVEIMQNREIIAYSSNVECIDLNSNLILGLDRKFIPGIFDLNQFLLRFDSSTELVFNGCSAAYLKSALVSLRDRPIETEDFTLYLSSLINGHVFFDSRKMVKYRVNNPQQASSINGFIDRLIQLDHLLSVALDKKVTTGELQIVFRRRILKEAIKSIFDLKILNALILLTCLFL